MSTVENTGPAAVGVGEVLIAGVPWPVYKVVAVGVGVVVLLAVGVVTASAGSAVLSAAASATVAWLVLGRAVGRRRGDRPAPAHRG